METINIKELRDMLLPIMDEARVKLASQGLPKSAEAHFIAMQKVLGMILIFLSESERKGEIDMNKLKNSLTVEVVRMGDIPMLTREGTWPQIVLEKIKELDVHLDSWKKQGAKPEDKPMLAINSKDIAYTHLSTVMTRLRKHNLVDESVKLRKIGASYYLAKV